MALPTPGSEERLAAATLATAFGDAVVVLDDTGRVVAWNDAAERIDGMAIAGSPGRPLAEVVPAGWLVAAVRVELADGGTVLAWPAAHAIGEDDVAREKARILEHLAPGVAHDLINQVGGIQGFLQVIDQSDERDREMLAETAGRAMDTVKAFQGLVRTRLAGTTSMPPADLVAEAVALSAEPLHAVELRVDVPDDLPHVECEPAHVRQALLAVLVSSMDALGWPAAHGSIRLSARASGPRVEIVIDDDGPGLGGDADLPFSTAAALGGRDVLDLAVARHLLRLDGGDAAYAPRPGGGNRIVLAIPTAGGHGAGDAGDGMADDLTAVPSGPAAAGLDGTKAILVCDDEDSVRSLIVRVLARAGLATAEAASAEAALAVLGQRPVAVVLADHHLGAMTGLDLYERAVDLRPELRGRFILMSGDAGDAELVESARELGLRVIAKPFADLGGLPGLVRDVAAT